MGKKWKQWETIFWGSKVTEDGDCSRQIKRCLLLGRKAMTNINSVLNNTDITLPTKVHIVKAMVFPVIMYGCESWIIKAAECWRIDDSELWCWGRLLKSPLANKIKPVHPKGNQAWIFIERTDAEAPILWSPNAKNRLIRRLWCWAKLKAAGEGDDRGWDGWMASLIQWTRVWASSRKWWRIGKPGVLQSTGPQRVRHDWVTEQQHDGKDWNHGVLEILALSCSFPFTQCVWPVRAIPQKQLKTQTPGPLQTSPLSWSALRPTELVCSESRLLYFFFFFWQGATAKPEQPYSEQSLAHRKHWTHVCSG